MADAVRQIFFTARRVAQWFAAANVVVLLTACGGGGSDADVRGLTRGPADCSIVSQNEFVYDYLRDFYFWADEVDPTANPASYTSPAELLEDLKFSPTDRFSTVLNADAFDNFQEGQFIGVGLYVVRDVNDDPVIGFAHQGSPADLSGLKRGDKITEINGVRGANLRDRAQYNAAFGDGQVGSDVVIKVRPRGEAGETTHNLTNQRVVINPTPIVNVLEHAGFTIGYLQFTNFFGNATDELRDAFAQFAAAGVNELVLDLRYNGGGRLSVAALLASLIGGERSDDETFNRLVYNRQHSDLNVTFRFANPSNSLSLSRLIVLTTEATCSASEAVINGLRGAGFGNNPATPIDVVVVGATTCGKPVGSNAQYFCDSVMPTITFELRNAQNQGGYFNGLAATCAVNDDLSNDLGNRNEALLASALDYIGQNRCPIAATRAQQRSTRLPALQNMQRNR